MKNKNYDHLFVDYNDPHESNEFWIRINQAFANSSHTLKSLSDSIGVSERTLSRFLSKKTYGDVIRLIYDVSHSCGITPDVLFNRQIHIPNQDLTGIKSIDRMITEAYNDSSETGIEGFRKYVGKEYRLYHERWKIRNDTKHNRITRLLTPDPNGTPTLTYENELKLNKEVAEINKHHRRLQIHSAYFAGEMVVVQYSVFETKRDEFNNKTTKNFHHIDHLTLDRTLEEYSENSRLIPKIKTRQWSEIKMPDPSFDLKE